MEGEAFFLDTYAIHEIVEGRESYKRFSGESRIITAKLNLMEAYYVYLVKRGAVYAESVFEHFNSFCVGISDEDFKEAMRFKAGMRRLNPRSNLSYVDAVGYSVAKRHKVKFLTGDREFKGMENVEFVK